MKFIIPYRNRIKKIEEFKKLLEEYIELGIKRHLTDEDIKRYDELREIIAQKSDEIELLVRKADVGTTMYYSPPPAVGGMAGPLNLFSNLFNLSDFQISKQLVVDLLNRAIGSYNYKQKYVIIRIINPLFWVGEIIRIPFRILSFAGFNANEIELSIIGKIYKAIAGFTVFVWALIQILDYFGFDMRSIILP